MRWRSVAVLQRHQRRSDVQSRRGWGAHRRAANLVARMPRCASTMGLAIDSVVASRSSWRSTMTGKEGHAVGSFRQTFLCPRIQVAQAWMPTTLRATNAQNFSDDFSGSAVAVEGPGRSRGVSHQHVHSGASRVRPSQSVQRRACAHLPSRMSPVRTRSPAPLEQSHAPGWSPKLAEYPEFIAVELRDSRARVTRAVSLVLVCA
jgi:hypothetical protein